jgi:hypothetical protein
VITPDTKNWTWVIEHPCAECGFDASKVRPADVAGLIRNNAGAWDDLSRSGTIHPGRPNPERWSSLEYAAHVRDVYRRYDERIASMLSTDDPLFANWDQDASAVEEDYESQDAGTVVAELQRHATHLADRLAALTPEAWQRPGRRSDGASFSVDSISRYMIHDTVHHMWDVVQDRDSNTPSDTA